MGNPYLPGGYKEYYIRDAQGNIMAMYRYTNSGPASLQVTERPLYGSGRVGSYAEAQQLLPATAVPANYVHPMLPAHTRYELADHLGNVRATVSGQLLPGNNAGSPYQPELVSAQGYEPFGSLLPGRNYSSDSYRFGFNGKLKDDEIHGATGTSYDFGARIYDPRIGRWLACDPLAAAYPGISPYVFVMNTPLSAVDPDGKLVLFIGGLRLWQGRADQPGPLGPGGGLTGIYRSDVFNYWSTEENGRNWSTNGQNSFGRPADIAEYFTNTIGDQNAYFTSGSSHWDSQADQRQQEGAQRAAQFHAMVQSGEIVLAKDETIKIVSHSQGGAHAAGFVEALNQYTDADGNRLYNVEVIYYITPHQPGDIEHPSGVRGVQYSHPSDAVSSASPWWMPNGGSEFRGIPGVAERVMGDIMGGNTGTPCEGPGGNRCGHNVTDNDQFIRDSGTVKPRHD